MLIHIEREHPQPRQIKRIAAALNLGEIIIYPTDSVYGLGCDIFQRQAIERVCMIKQVDPHKAQLSFVCNDLSDLSRYTKSISTPLFRLLKSYLPGPYTFILPASKEVPRILKSKKETIGLRVPANAIARAIVKELGHPVLSTSLPGEMVEEYTDPQYINEKFGSRVDLIVDGGIGGVEFSTVVDCTVYPPELLRQGAGEWYETSGSK